MRKKKKENKQTNENDNKQTKTYKQKPENITTLAECYVSQTKLLNRRDMFDSSRLFKVGTT